MSTETLQKIMEFEIETLEDYDLLTDFGEEGTYSSDAEEVYIESLDDYEERLWELRELSDMEQKDAHLSYEPSQKLLLLYCEEYDEDIEDVLINIANTK